MKWAQVVIDRLTTCVHVYSKPSYEDVFIAEKERQEKNAATLSLLRRIHGLVDDGDTPTESLADVAHHDEQIIDGLTVLFREALGMLPPLSADMQKLLKSEWFDKCNGRLASELFRGPMGNMPEGIGSGYPEQGRLPEVLAALLQRERVGDARQPRKELHRHDDDADKSVTTDLEPSEPSSRARDSVKRRWADKNAQSLRSAGRVE